MQKLDNEDELDDEFVSPDELNVNGIGYIEPSYFNKYIVPPGNNTVIDDRIWFIYMFHSHCRS